MLSARSLKPASPKIQQNLLQTIHRYCPAHDHRLAFSLLKFTEFLWVDVAIVMQQHPFEHLRNYDFRVVYLLL